MIDYELPKKNRESSINAKYILDISLILITHRLYLINKKSNYKPLNFFFYTVNKHAFLMLTSTIFYFFI